MRIASKYVLKEDFHRKGGKKALFGKKKKESALRKLAWLHSHSILLTNHCGNTLFADFGGKRNPNHLHFVAIPNCYQPVTAEKSLFFLFIPIGKTCKPMP